MFVLYNSREEEREEKRKVGEEERGLEGRGEGRGQTITILIITAYKALYIGQNLSWLPASALLTLRLSCAMPDAALQAVLCNAGCC